VATLACCGLYIQGLDMFGVTAKQSIPATEEGKTTASLDGVAAQS
jgi:hypothetical protein